MYLTTLSADLLTADADTLLIGLAEGESHPALDSATGGAFADQLAAAEFTGKTGQTATVFPRGGGLTARRVVVVGLGKPDALTPDGIRRAAGSALGRARALKSKKAAAAIFGGGSVPAPVAAGMTAEGLLMAAYQYHGQKSGEPPTESPESVALHLPTDLSDADRITYESEISTARAFAAANHRARTLTNLPPNICTPTYLADVAAEIAAAGNLQLEVLEKGQMEALKMGALLGVTRGSVTPPKFIVLEHAPERAAEGRTLVLVGKGITFDTGGYSIKTADGMVAMKNDMAGGAAVLSAMEAIATLKVPRHVVGIVPACANMISGEAVLPSEVLTASNGTTIEIISTDAEGRLILADALVYAARFKPAAVVDIATLTGSMSVALGNLAAGFFSTDTALQAALSGAGEATGERLWPMPLYPEYEKALESKTADLKNSSGGRYGGACVAALFLKRFTNYPAWAHIDMAGVASEGPENPILPGGGATGYGARLLTELARRG